MNRSLSVIKILAKAVDFYLLFVSMVLSELLLGNVVFGGALCLMGQVWVSFIRMHGRHPSKTLPAKLKAKGFALFMLALVLNIALMIVYPRTTENENFLLMLLFIVIALLEQMSSGLVTYGMNIKTPKRGLFLLGIHACFSVILVLLIRVTIDGANAPSLTLLTVGGSFLTCLVQMLSLPHSGKDEPIYMEEDGAVQISAFNLYNKMTANVLTAINIAIIAYICYVRYDPAEEPLYGFLSLLAWLFFSAGIGGLFYLFLTRKRALFRYDKPSVFVFGAVLWTLSSIISYNKILPKGFLRFVLTNALWGAGMAAMLAVTVSLWHDMQSVLELGIPEEQTRAYRRNTEAMVEWKILCSLLLMLVMFTVSSFVLDGKLDRLEARLGMQDFMRTVMLLLPAAFILAALINALMQPLNKHYWEKLKLYRTQMQEGVPSTTLYDKLLNELYRKKQRLSYRFLRCILRPIMPCKVVGKENVDTSDGPVIFVCNHLESYGPMITNLHMPFYFRPWIIFRMLDKDLIADNLKPGVDRVLRIFPEKWRQKVPDFVAPLMLHIMESTDPIPVYRDSGRDVIKTIRLTVDAMVDKDNILLFPENPQKSVDGQYQEEGASAFYTGFVAVAEQYYKKTGNRAVFYPVYADKNHRTLTIGEGIAFDPENAKSPERQRIAEELCRWMNERSKQA